MQKGIGLGLLGVAFAVSLLWGAYEYRQAEDFRLAADNRYHHAFKDLAGHLDQLETDMAKGRVAGTTNQKVFYLSQAGSRSEAAMKDLAMLPAEENGLSYLGEFLNRIGDFSRNLSHRAALGITTTAAEERTLTEVHERLRNVNQTVQDLVARVDTENLAWTNKAPNRLLRLSFWQTETAEAAAESADGPASSVRSGLDQLNASLQKLPPFSYTGEFEARSVKEPLGLPGQEVSKDKSAENARDFLNKIGIPGVTPEFAGVSQGPMGGYLWQHGDIFMTVSKRGGVVTQFRDQRESGERTLTPDQAKSKTEENLKKLGWKLVLTSTEDYGGFLRLEYVDEIEGIRYYPDKVRLTVALDNGQITGYDATPYWAYHQNRVFTAKIPSVQARSRLKEGFQIKETRQAVIPVMGNREVLAYEFRGMYQGEEYLVYINADNGIEEKIQRIIRTPRGEYLQ